MATITIEETPDLMRMTAALIRERPEATDAELVEEFLMRRPGHATAYSRGDGGQEVFFVQRFNSGPVVDVPGYIAIVRVEMESGLL